MTRSLRCALVACAWFGAGCSGGTLDGPGEGTGGAPSLPPAPQPGSGGAVGSGGSGPVQDAGSGGASVEVPPPVTTDGGPVTGWDSSAADPGTDGDGIRMLTGPYRAAPEFTRGAGVPAGKSFRFTMGSMLFPRAPANRAIAVYVPSQYKMGTPAALMVFQDGTNFYSFDSAVPPVLDNLIAKGSVPPIVAIFISNGGGDSVGSERGLEYDTVSGLYAEWVDKEVLPRVELETKTRMPTQAVTFTKDPEGRGTMGGSSGGAASFSMAWWHPDLFRRVITFSGTYVTQVPAGSPFPHGCWIYHDKDPYDAAAPNGLIMEHCESATDPTKGSSNPGPCDTPLTRTACEAVNGCAWNTKVNKPIRIWHESGSNDLGAGGSPTGYRNFDLANQRMAAAFKARGYHFHYDHAQGAGHVDQAPLRQTLPEGLTWLWRGYKASGN